MIGIICFIKIKSQSVDLLIVVDVTDVIRTVAIVMEVGSSHGCAVIKRCKIFFINIFRAHAWKQLHEFNSTTYHIVFHLWIYRKVLYHI